MKRTFQPSVLKEKEPMVLGLEWPLKLVGRFLQTEERKAEKSYLHNCGCGCWVIQSLKILF